MHGDHLFELAKLVVLQLVRHAEQGAGGARRRAVEENADDFAQCRLLGDRIRDDRAVQETAIGFIALDEALVFKALEHGANSRAAELDGQSIADFCNGHRAALIEDVHNLAFARGQFAEHSLPFGATDSPRYICRVLHL